ncbi:proteasome lid subunit RPN8/RPN11 [Streptomyces sp. HB372]|nr:proteasome lid subunit RPN8/RPN11 [Streptomyces sp. HB372]
MLTITQALHDQIVAHSRADHPDEACGVVAGPAGTDRPERFIPMLNAARSPTFYEFDSADLLKLYREMDDRDEEPVIVYHSHTATEAYPSRTDVTYANEPGAHYVLVSTADTDDAGPFQFRSYRIVDGEITEEDVRVVEAVLTQPGTHQGAPAGPPHGSGTLPPDPIKAAGTRKPVRIRHGPATVTGPPPTRTTSHRRAARKSGTGPPPSRIDQGTRKSPGEASPCPGAPPRS